MTTRPTDDDLRVIVQTLAISGSLGEDDALALFREIDVLRADLEGSRREADRFLADRERFRAVVQVMRRQLAEAMGRDHDEARGAGEGADA